MGEAVVHRIDDHRRYDALGGEAARSSELLSDCKREEIAHRDLRHRFIDDV